MSAGKYRRYSGLTFKERVTDIKTPLLNVRDARRTLKGYKQARKLLKELKPDVMLIKGGFIGVPMGLAASQLGVPFLTHDSDSIPGLANRIVSRWAILHATGMPAELYSYPKEKTIYTGIPVSDEYKRVTSANRAAYRAQIGLSDCKQIFTVVGGSQGGEQLNNDVILVTARLMEKFPKLGVVHIAGTSKLEEVEHRYDKVLSRDSRHRVIVKGFVKDLHLYSGAADVVVTRAGANATAEFALQGLPLIIVPGRLAGGHQDKNAAYFVKNQAAVSVPYGDADTLYTELYTLLSDVKAREKLGHYIHALAKPFAAKELAEATLKLAEKQR